MQTEALLARRLAGEPIAYLIGEWSFCGLPFYVSPEALIPRVDTEMLAQLAMNRLKENPGHTRIWTCAPAPAAWASPRRPW